jgi:hypothetical protein
MPQRVDGVVLLDKPLGMSSQGAVTAVKRALKRLEELEDEAKDLTEKKPWINQTQVDEVLKFTQEVKSWLDEALAK